MRSPRPVNVSQTNPGDRYVDLLSVLDRVARAIESVVPGLYLTAEIGGQVWLEEETENADGSAVSSGRGEWVAELGFAINYRDEHHGAFGHASAGAERERIQAVARELMSDVQDIVSEMTTEPWPLIVVNGRRDMAMANAAIEEDELHMWYGDRKAPALRLPAVRLFDDAG
jgi:hypothetical protein